MIAPLACRGSAVFDISVFTEECTIVAVVALISLETNMQSGAIADRLADTAMHVTSGIRVDVSAGADANTWAAVVTALDFICMLASSDEALLLGRKGRS